MNIVNANFLVKDQSKWPDNFVYVGRPSVLGNPFSHDPRWVDTKRGGRLCRNRNDAIEAYEDWLTWKVMLRDKKVMKALCAITMESTLVCWCFPQECHAMVIMRLHEIAHDVLPRYDKIVDSREWHALLGDVGNYDISSGG